MLTEAQREEMKVRDDESPGEYKVRVDGLMEKWSLEHRQKLDTKREACVTPGSPGPLMAARAKDQERNLEAAVSEFESSKRRLYRGDGSRVYGEKEHAERLGKLTDELREKIEAVVLAACEDAEGYERKALAFSYTDPASLVSGSERGRLESSRAFVKEDCEDMTVPELAERVSAATAGSDTVAKVLHARYGQKRLQVLNAEALRSAKEGRLMGPEAAAEQRRLEEAVSCLEEKLVDPKRAKHEQSFRDAAAKSREVARSARTRLSEADGTDERARRAYASYVRATF